MPETAARDKQIWQERQTGDAYQVIAERRGLSLGGVRQICAHENRSRKIRGIRLQAVNGRATT